MIGCAVPARGQVFIFGVFIKGLRFWGQAFILESSSPCAIRLRFGVYHCILYRDGSTSVDVD